MLHQQHALPSLPGCKHSIRPCNLRVNVRQRPRPTLLHNKLGDDLLDFVTAGPKMRKWYGQAPRGESAKDEPKPSPSGRDQQQQQEEDSGTREYVLVTDAESATGEQVVLQLILARAKTRVLVRDVGAARSGYGPYVDPVSVSVDSPGGLAAALRGVKVVVALGRLGGLLPAAKAAGVEAVVLLSTAGMPARGGLAALFGSKEDAGLADASREAALAASGLPYVVLRTTGDISDTPGGSSAVDVTRVTPGAASSSSSSSSSSAKMAISREDLAAAVAGCALGLSPEAAGSGVVVSVLPCGPGQPPSDWQQLMAAMATAA